MQNISYGILTCQQALNQPDNTWPAKDARRLKDQFKLAAEPPSLIEWINKPQRVDPCIRTLTHLPDVSKQSAFLAYSNILILCMWMKFFVYVLQLIYQMLVGEAYVPH
jgi:hypothetical protein